MLNIGEFARLGQVSPRMLRHYDETGLLKPGAVDPQTGYRLYDVASLGRLHRLLALRDLGFTLEQIRPLLDDNVPVEQLRGMLRLGRAQIEQNVEAEQARLRRVEAHLRALEGSTTMQLHDVVIKQAEPIRLAEAGHRTRIRIRKSRPPLRPAPPRGPRPPDPGRRPAGHLGGPLRVAAGRRQRRPPRRLRHRRPGRPLHRGRPGRRPPAVQVASVIHRGAMEGIEPAFEALVRWIEDSGYRMAGPSRELYHEFHLEDPPVTSPSCRYRSLPDSPTSSGRFELNYCGPTWMPLLRTSGT